MISYIHGILTVSTPSYAIIEAGGVGYKIFITSMTFAKLPQIKTECTLHTVHIVREQFQALYGFLQPHACDLFETLIGVSGIGPKIALSILGHMTEGDFAQAIANGDIPLLSKIPGIGKKTAERLLIEMRDKVGVAEGAGSVAMPIVNTAARQAMNALINLGYTQAVAQKAVKKTMDKLDVEEPHLAELISESLKHV